MAFLFLVVTALCWKLPLLMMWYATEKWTTFIPANLKRCHLINFHLDNSDFAEDFLTTIDGLLLVRFRQFEWKRAPQPFSNIDIDANGKTKYLLPNNFGELLPCTTPSVRNYERSSGCENITPQKLSIPPEKEMLKIETWLYARSLEWVATNTFIVDKNQEVPIETEGISFIARKFWTNLPLISKTMRHSSHDFKSSCRESIYTII